MKRDELGVVAKLPAVSDVDKSWNSMRFSKLRGNSCERNRLVIDSQSFRSSASCATIFFYVPKQTIPNCRSHRLQHVLPFAVSVNAFHPTPATRVAFIVALNGNRRSTSPKRLTPHYRLKTISTQFAESTCVIFCEFLADEVLVDDFASKFFAFVFRHDD